MSRKKYTTLGVTEEAHQILAEYRDEQGYGSFQEMLKEETNADFEE